MNNKYTLLFKLLLLINILKFNENTNQNKIKFHDFQKVIITIVIYYLYC